MIRATHYTYSYGEGHEAKETRYFGTRRAAQLWAESILQPTVTTNDCYWRDVGRANNVRCEPQMTRAVKRGTQRRQDDFKAQNRAYYLEPPVVIVPSVGELGYW